MAEQTKADIEKAIDAVRSLDEDRILRSFLSVVRAMLRTNYFRGTIVASETARRRTRRRREPPSAHLRLVQARLRRRSRCSRCRGRSSRSSSTRPASRASTCAAARSPAAGMRWSDRREDFRTEVLGLMKAQMVKNALIVPVGSKGGFVVKRPPHGGGREALTDEGIACYKTFLGGLLDLTDNIVGGECVTPERVVRYDDDDPYLVVAADKGTATLLGHRQRDLRPVRLLARAMRSPPAARRATTTSRWGSPRAARGSR